MESTTTDAVLTATQDGIPQIATLLAENRLRSPPAAGFDRVRAYDAAPFFVGDPRIRYTAIRSTSWSPGSRAKIVAKRTNNTYVVANNHFLGNAVVNAFETVSLLFGRPVEAPEELRQRYPVLEQGLSGETCPGRRHNEGGASPWVCCWISPPACKRPFPIGGKTVGNSAQCDVVFG